MKVVVSTPSRLHFGLLRFAEPAGPSYGGLGMMIDQPRWRIELSLADEWHAHGESSDRALVFAQTVLATLAPTKNSPHLNIDVRQAIPPHRGFGGGTQLGLAVAAGVRRLLGLPAAPTEELAQLAGRGLRSAVGAHGFIHGGLIWELGRLPGESLGRLARRVAVPDTWRVVLVDAGVHGGLSGENELAAFRTLPSPSPGVVAQLVQLAQDLVLPAAESSDFTAFSDGVFRYGRLAGECFAPIQGGPYASAAIARCVEVLDELGCRGAGQSSWGPTVFAFTDSQRQAESLLGWLATHPDTRAFATEICHPDNVGATIKTI